MELYEELCVGPIREESETSIMSLYATLKIEPGCSIIYAKAEHAFSVPICVLHEDPGYSTAHFDVTWRVAEPEFLEIVSVDRAGSIAMQSGYAEDIPTYRLPSGQQPGFVVRGLQPGVAHLYITLIHRETGCFLTM